MDRPSTDSGGREFGRFLLTPLPDATGPGPAVEELGALGPSGPLGTAPSGYPKGLEGNGKGTRSETGWSCEGRDCRIRLRLAFCLGGREVGMDLIPLISGVCDSGEVNIFDFLLRGFAG